MIPSHFLEEHALLLSRLGRHEEVLHIYVRQVCLCETTFFRGEHAVQLVPTNSSAAARTQLSFLAVVHPFWWLGVLLCAVCRDASPTSPTRCFASSSQLKNRKMAEAYCGRIWERCESAVKAKSAAKQGASAGECHFHATLRDGVRVRVSM